MNDLVDPLVAELRKLPPGRGIAAPDLLERLGPLLREWVADGSGDPSRISRPQLVARLEKSLVRLPGDMADAFGAALGLLLETQGLLNLQDREEWLAARLNCSPRTAHRRVLEAGSLLAQEIADTLRVGRSGKAETGGWFLKKFTALLRLDTPSPESHERRVLVATRDGLSEVRAWLDVPRDPDHPRPRVEGEVSYGGTLVRRNAPGHGAQCEFIVQLPRPLRRGERHEYGLILRIPAGEVMRPHYVFTPECDCDEFELSIKFDPARLPRWVRKVDGETVRMFDTALPDARPTPLDAAHELHLQFPRPARYLGYGAQWASS